MNINKIIIYLSLVFLCAFFGHSAIAAKFSIGDRVQVTANVNVRSTPSNSGTLLGTQPKTYIGTVVGGPMTADGFTWWNINYDNNPDGWSIENSLLKVPITALPLGNCSSETSLGGRTDIVMCEPWETTTWWQNGFVDSARNPATSTTVQRTSIVSSGCISGSCLKADMLEGETTAVSVKWPLSNAGLAPEELYLRYYIKLGPNWNPLQCSGGTVVGRGGKFPGLADERIPSDPVGQCGNGGDPGDGINCWTMRSNFADCNAGGKQSCALNGVPNATMRFGSYLYFIGQTDPGGSYTGLPGHWDSYLWDQWPVGGGTCQVTPTNLYCGIGNRGMFENNKWYLVEMYVKMNTPGQANGIIRGWVDGILSYQKTNMIFRLLGHNNLHVRNMWFDVYKGGVNGNCVNSEVYFDQMVMATGAQIGPWQGNPGDTTPPASPKNLKAQ